MSDICIKAKKYLYLIGKSNVNDNISQLTNGVINWSNFPPSFGESAIRNDTLDIDADDVVFDIPFDDSKELSTFTETIDTVNNYDDYRLTNEVHVLCFIHLLNEHKHQVVTAYILL